MPEDQQATSSEATVTASASASGSQNDTHPSIIVLPNDTIPVVSTPPNYRSLGDAYLLAIPLGFLGKYNKIK